MSVPLSSLTKLVDELVASLKKKREAEEEMAELAKQVLAASGDPSKARGPVPTERGLESPAKKPAATRAIELKMALQQLSYAQQEAEDTISSVSDAIALVRQSICASIVDWDSSADTIGKDYRDRIALEQENYALAKQERRRLEGRLRAHYNLLKETEQSI